MKLKKRLLILPLLSSFLLTGCDVEDLKFWEKIDFSAVAFWKKKEEKQEVIDDDNKTEPTNTDGDNSGSDTPVVETNWSQEVQALMKEHLDNVVLPFIEGTWTWVYDEEYEEIYGTSYDATLANATAAFSSWDNLGEDDYGDTWYGKETANGQIQVVPYADEGGFIAIEAFFLTVDEDWSDASKALMTEFMGFALPFINGSWKDFEESEGTIGTSGTNVDMSQAKTALEGAGFTVSLDQYEDISATIETESFVITVDLQDWTSLMGVYTLEISKAEKVAEWPADEIAEVVGVYMDYEPEVVPQPENATSFAISEGDYGMIISCAGATQSAYMAQLEALGWEISDYYLDYYGIYSAYSPNHTIEIDIYDGVSPLKIEIMASQPEFSVWPSQYVNPFVSETIGSIYSIPAFEGQDAYTYNEGLVEDEETGDSYMAGGICVYAETLSETTFKGYSDLLESNGFSVSYTAESDSNYAQFHGERGRIGIDGVYYSTYYNMYYFMIYAVDAEESPIVFEKDNISLLAGGSEQIAASLLDGFEGELSFESKNEGIATVSSTGFVTAVAKGSTEIEVSVTINEREFTSIVAVNVLEQATEVSIVGDSAVSNGKSATYSVSFPEGTFSPEEPVWSIVSGGDYASIDASTGELTAVNSVDADKEVVISVTVGALSSTKTVTIKAVTEVKDTLTLAKLDLSSIGTTYTNFSGKKDASDAVYAGQCAGSYDSIQIRSKNNNSGVYSSTSGGTIKSVTLTYNSADTNKNGIKIVASNSPFASTSDLYSATVVATLNKGNDGTATYEFEEEYAYVGIISASGAHYLDSIEFVWVA